MRKHRVVLGLLLTLSATAHLVAQVSDDYPWHGKQCAVSLTYDDALNVHLDNVAPLLDSLGLRATFYISGFFPGFKTRTADWMAVAEKGNELGNHTLFHPCKGNIPGREWVKPDYDLGTYTRKRLVDEIEMGNVLLKAIDGRDRRTFAYPCGDTRVGDSSYVEDIAARFPGARSVEGRMERIGTVDRLLIGSFVISGQSGDDLVKLVESALERKALVVFLFHGVGGEHSLDVSLEAHSQLLHYLKAHEREIWVAPLIDVAEYLKQSQARPR